MDEEESNVDQLLRAIVFLSVLVVNVIVWGTLIAMTICILND